MKHKAGRHILPGPSGISFILVILVILMLVVFAVLSLATALRDYEDSMRAAEKTTAYYEANNQAYEILREVDEALTGSACTEETLTGGSSEKESVSVEEALEALKEIPDLTVARGDEMDEALAQAGYIAEVSYAVAINSSQELSVTLGIREDENGAGVYQICGWKESAIDSWEGDDSLSVWGNE